MLSSDEIDFNRIKHEGRVGKSSQEKLRGSQGPLSSFFGRGPTQEEFSQIFNKPLRKPEQREIKVSVEHAADAGRALKAKHDREAEASQTPTVANPPYSALGMFAKGSQFRRMTFDDIYPLGFATGKDPANDYKVVEAYSVVLGLGNPLRSRTSVSLEDRTLEYASDSLPVNAERPGGFDRASMINGWRMTAYSRAPLDAKPDTVKFLHWRTISLETQALGAALRKDYSLITSNTKTTPLKQSYTFKGYSRESEYRGNKIRENIKHDAVSFASDSNDPVTEIGFNALYSTRESQEVYKMVRETPRMFGENMGIVKIYHTTAGVIFEIGRKSGP
ncbi:hypothetical protein ABW19_dt0208415 [Dactylella cylindrospora]|nr:hypothetical protein ABW19_dt0208415 [Dactylella cylindrospora]